MSPIGTPEQLPPIGGRAGDARELLSTSMPVVGGASSAFGSMFRHDSPGSSGGGGGGGGGGYSSVSPMFGSLHDPVWSPTGPSPTNPQFALFGGSSFASDVTRGMHSPNGMLSPRSVGSPRGMLSPREYASYGAEMAQRSVRVLFVARLFRPCPVAKQSFFPLDTF